MSTNARTEKPHLFGMTLRQQLYRIAQSRTGILLLIAIFVGFSLRIVWLGDVPPGFNQDEAVSAYDAFSIARTGRDHHGHPFPFTALESFGDWVSPLLTFVSVPAVGIFGPRAEVVRTVSALIGTIAIPLVYGLARLLWNQRAIAVVAAWLVAVSPWHITLSRFAIPPSIVPTMLSLTLTVLLWALRERSNRGLVLAAIAAGLTVASYPTMKLFIPLLGTMIALLYWRTLVAFKREVLFYAVIILIIITGPIYYLSILDPGGRARMTQVSIFQHEALSFILLLKQYLVYISPSFLLLSGDRYANTVPPGSGVELRSTIPFFVAGGFWMCSQIICPREPNLRKPAALMVATLLLYPVAGALTVPNPYALRAVHLIPLSAITSAVGIVLLANVARRTLRATERKRTKKSVVLALSLTMLLVMGAELVGRYHNYYIAHQARVALKFHLGLEEALAYARTYARDFDEIWVSDVNQPYIYVLAYAQWPPSDVHSNLHLRRHPPDFNQVDGIGKYRFPELWGKPPADIKPEALKLVHTVYAPNKRVAYELRRGYVEGRGQVLLIYQPEM